MIVVFGGAGLCLAFGFILAIASFPAKGSALGIELALGIVFLTITGIVSSGLLLAVAWFAFRRYYFGIAVIAAVAGAMVVMVRLSDVSRAEVQRPSHVVGSEERPKGLEAALIILARLIFSSALPIGAGVVVLVLGVHIASRYLGGDPRRPRSAKPAPPHSPAPPLPLL